MQIFFKLKITSKNTGFLPSHDPHHHIDQLSKPYRAQGQFRENFGKNPLSIGKSYKVSEEKRL